MNVIKSISLICALIVSLTLAACVNDSTAPMLQATATDYSQASHWLSLPVPLKAIDVFYLYPTVWQKINPTDPNICEINNASMLTGAAVVFGRQATAFETVGYVYAPYYRQADAIYALNLPEDEREILIGGIPTGDAVAAFGYYIKHFNNGRPFILVAHSQGSKVLIHLLSGYMKDNPDVYKRMIAAYVVGYSVTIDYLAANSHLKFAEGPDDTGVIISYNTQAPDAGTNPVVLPGALAINPITWTRDKTVATVSDGLGSFMPDAAGVYLQVPQYADARVDKTKGVVICSTADEDALSGPFGRGIYHIFDYSFYYHNIRANAQNRANKFLGI